MKTQQQQIAEQATGCLGAGDYAKWAKQQGYPFCEVWDWSSSAGDWSFLVSQNGLEWFWMFQENNYPRPGFTRTIDKSQIYHGTWDVVQKEVFLQILRLEDNLTFREKWMLACAYDEVDPDEEFVVFSEDNPYL